jgi:phosphoglycolate phosphatase-like HAD superfamily hydrolase
LIAEFAEIIRPWPIYYKISHMVFDFDGTLSWLRHGWPSIMSELFRGYYPEGSQESEEQIQQKLDSIIFGLNGKPTIFQMSSFAAMLGKMGSTCPEPEHLLERYQERLEQAISRRLGKIQQGETGPDQYLVYGARPFLEVLYSRGIKLYILSSTLEHRVREEAACLQISHYFQGNIIGGTGNPLEFSKKKAFELILEKEKIQGRQLLSLGDGPVEISDTCRLGGLAIGVASNEEFNGSGIPDPGKRLRLIEAGAHLIIPDFHNSEKLAEFILRR